jgi:glutathione peroxidase
VVQEITPIEHGDMNISPFYLPYYIVSDIFIHDIKPRGANMNQSFYDFEAIDNSGTAVPMAKFQGKTVLVVNTASNCGFTPQYEGLQQLYEAYADRGLVILGFPCDQFGHQEPGTDSEIYQFCKTNFGVSFPLFKKINVNGPDAHPLYQYLRKEMPGAIGDSIKWNFTKFLINPDGSPVKRFAPQVEPEKLIPYIEKSLNAAA